MATTPQTRHYQFQARSFAITGSDFAMIVSAKTPNAPQFDKLSAMLTLMKKDAFLHFQLGSSTISTGIAGEYFHGNTPSNAR